MRKIKARLISSDEFTPFGMYYNMIHPEGYAFCGEIHKFYPDRIRADSCCRLGLSSIQIKKTGEMIIATVECHTTTWEMILPLNDDMVIHVTPASGTEPAIEHTKAFIVPKGTAVILYAAIWHFAPLPLNESELSVMVISRECTYINDCNVVNLAEEQRFEIIV